MFAPRFIPENGPIEFQLEQTTKQLQDAYAKRQKVEADLQREKTALTITEEDLSGNSTLGYYTNSYNSTVDKRNSTLRAFDEVLAVKRKQYEQSVEAAKNASNLKINAISTAEARKIDIAEKEYEAAVQKAELKRDTAIKLATETATTKRATLENSLTKELDELRMWFEQRCAAYQTKENLLISNTNRQMSMYDAQLEATRSKLQNPSSLKMKRLECDLDTLQREIRRIEPYHKMLTDLMPAALAEKQKQRLEDERLEAIAAEEAAKAEGERIWEERCAREQAEYEARAAERGKAAVEVAEGQRPLPEAEINMIVDSNPASSAASVIVSEPVEPVEPVEPTHTTEELPPPVAPKKLKFSSYKECANAYYSVDTIPDALEEEFDYWSAVRKAEREKLGITRPTYKAPITPPESDVEESVEKVCLPVKSAPQMPVWESPPLTPEEERHLSEARSKVKARHAAELAKLHKGNIAKIRKDLAEVHPTEETLQPKVITSTRVKPAPGQRFRL